MRTLEQIQRDILRATKERDVAQQRLDAYHRELQELMDNINQVAAQLKAA